VSVCDVNLNTAQSFATTWKVPSAFGSLESMLKSERLDCIHVLAPPDRHHALAKIGLKSRVHVFLEKPICTSIDEIDELLTLAVEKGLRIGVNHNFLFTSAYQRLRKFIHSKALGPLSHLTINYFFELDQIRLGPFNAWMLRTPGNVLLEVGPHLISAMLDLAG